MTYLLTYLRRLCRGDNKTCYKMVHDIPAHGNNILYSSNQNYTDRNSECDNTTENNKQFTLHN